MQRSPQQLPIACLTGLSLILAPIASHAAPDRFARFSTQPSRIYAGQFFDLTLAIYNAGDTLDKSITISGMPPPDTLRCEPFQELALQQEVAENRIYEVRRFRAQAMAPVPGRLSLSPALQGTLIRESRSYFFVQRQTTPVSFSAEIFPLTILPLPEEGRPSTFSGAVGEFRLRAKASPLDIAVGDLVTVEVRIEGMGLPEALPPPTLPPVDGLKAYDARPIPAESSAAARTFRQTVVPVDQSLSALPALSFTFFNARTGRYETQTAGPFPLTFHAERTAIQPVYTPRTNAAGATPPPPRSETPGIWQRFLPAIGRTHIEQVSVPHDTEVRLAPADDAIVLFTLKRNMNVRVESRFEEWIRIESPEGTGWIRKPAMTRVLP